MCISRTTTSKTAATFKPSAHLRRLELRVSPIIRIKPAGSLYGGHAMAKVFLEMLAEVPQIKKRTLWRLRKFRKSKRERFGVCGTPANQKENVLALAEVPQIKKRTLWRLRDSRKSKRERFGVCGTPANQKENALAFAGLPQIKKRTFWRLRKFRKSKRKRFGACGSSASIPKSTLAVTVLYPSHSSGIRSLILSFKLTLQRFLEREIRSRRHPFRSDRSLGGHTLLRSISEVPI